MAREIISITGPMFAGKTTELIRLVDRERIAGNKCIIFKHKKDLRYNKGDDLSIITHGSVKYDKCDIKYVSSLDPELLIYISVGAFSVVGIEEGHFFKNIDAFALTLSKSNIKTYITSITSDFRQQPIEHIARLNARARIIYKDAICMECRKADALHTVRISKETELIIIGGSDIYKSVCDGCLGKYRSIFDEITYILVNLHLNIDIPKKEESFKKMWPIIRKQLTSINDAFGGKGIKIGDSIAAIDVYASLIN